ncbi:MAG: hypothetical protein WBG86_21345 [Polyangiales bacterium]
MGKAVALLALVAGFFVGGSVLGFVPGHYVPVHAPPNVLLAASALLIFLSLALLARDHRGSELLSGLILLAASFLLGWVTVYGPESVLGGPLDWIPPTVRRSLGQLMHGLGLVLCGITAFFGLRKLIG